MDIITRTEKSRLRKPLPAILIILGMLVFVAVHDYLSGPVLNLSVAYFIPITYAAWALGRKAAITTAVLADAPEILEEVRAMQMGSVPVVAALGNVFLRLLIYVFVAEVTLRLTESSTEARKSAEDLKVLNEKLQETYSYLDEDVKAAGALQAGVLAFTPPDVPGCKVGACLRYAGRTGGDFADAGIIGNLVYACVADISGKGIPAALFTTLLKHLLADSHQRGLRSVEAVEAVNSALCQALPPDKFITLFYAEVDPGNGHVDYINAGHTEGLIYRSVEGVIETVGATATFLGICMEHDRIFARSIDLQPGDVMVLYTDGATESRMHSGERLSDDLIRELVKEYAHLDAQEMADSICQSIEAETDEETRDDLTVLCVKIS